MLVTERYDELDRVFALSLDLLCIASMDGRFLRLNPAWEQSLGYRIEDLEGRQFLEFVHPDDIEATRQVIADLSAGKDVVDFTNRYRSRDGSYRWIEWRSKPFNGTQIYAAARDITERRQTEEALRRSEATARSIVESSPTAMHLYHLEPDNRLVLTGANPAADRNVGIPHRDLLGKTIEEAFPKLVGTGIPVLYRKVATGELGPQSFEIPYGDDRFSGFYDVHVFRTGADTIAVDFFDITGRKRDEQERARLEERLRQSQKMEAIGQLAGGVAHDFNNLLTPIIGYAEMLAEGLPPDGPHRTSVEQILRAAERARDLNRQLLAFGRKQVLELKPVDLRDVLLNFERLLRRAIREDIHIELSLPPTLGTVRADTGQIELVLMNLAVNAQDAMPGGGVLGIAVGDTTFEPGECPPAPGVTPGAGVTLSVSDTGIGIDKTTLPRIFEPFFTTKEHGKGTGLGLATVHGIVEQHGGHVEVCSEPGQGTTFTIRLPRIAETAAHLQSSAAAAPATQGGGQTILLMEDDEMVRQLVFTMLRKWGYRVLAAQSVEDCLRLAEPQATHIDLLLTDVVMPVMNGRQLYVQLHANRRNLKVLYMSGYAADLVAQHGVIDEGVAFIHKPFTISALMNKIREVLDGG